MDEITVDWVASTFPRPMTLDEKTRAQNLIDAAEDRILEEFERHGRDFHTEVATTTWLARATRRVTREMVSAAIDIGEGVGKKSASSATGPQSDSVTWADGIPVTWGGVFLTNAHRRDLGLISDNRPRWGFPKARFRDE